MKLYEYMESIRNKTVAVLGIGISNLPLLHLLASYHIDVTAYDKKEESMLGPVADELKQLGIRLSLGTDYLNGLHEDIIFRTPGLRPDIPEIEHAVANGSILTSEMEVFFQVCPCYRIAVTGSDGKTTTTTIISELLKKEGREVYLGGNIGHPLLSEADSMKEDGIAVLELSSFQLMTMKQSPEVAVITNLAPNHLDIHKGLQEYIDAKKNVFLHQNDCDTLVLNEDNDITRSFSSIAKGKVITFSRMKTLTDGVYCANGSIYSDGEEVLKTSDILIPGNHNIENYMAAIAAVRHMVSKKTIQAVAKTFGGVEHRIELVRELRGVKYYNDSIASSPSRTIAGLRSFKQKVILIAGGKDKGISYESIGPEIVEHVKALFLTGPTSEKIKEAVLAQPNYDPSVLPMVEMEGFKETILAASEYAKSGDIVILSPASTSFDRFKNFMERGNTFKSIVNEL